MSAVVVVDDVEIIFNWLDGGPIACPHCAYIGRPWLHLCPACGCPMRLRGGEFRYDGIDAAYRAQRRALPSPAEAAPAAAGRGR